MNKQSFALVLTSHYGFLQGYYIVCAAFALT